MGRTGKIIVFIILCFVILVPLAMIKEAGGGAVMWLGAVAIPFIYMSMFGKKEKPTNKKSDDIILNKDKNINSDIT